jgi:adenylate kinase
MRSHVFTVAVSCGELLRAQLTARPDECAHWKAYVDQRMLVPDEYVCPLVAERLLEPDCCDNGWVLDGFPASRSQAESLVRAGAVPNRIVLLNVDDATGIERVSLRRTDSVTGETYHLKTKPPLTEAIAARLVQHKNDREDVVRARAAEWHQHADDLSALFARRLHSIDASQSVQAVSESIDYVLCRPVPAVRQQPATAS